MKFWCSDYISCPLCCTISQFTVYPRISMPIEHISQCHLEKIISSRGRRTWGGLALRPETPPHSLAFS